MNNHQFLPLNGSLKIFISMDAEDDWVAIYKNLPKSKNPHGKGKLKVRMFKCQFAKLTYSANLNGL